MTFLEKIKPHLLSDDILVQETVLHAIQDYPYVPEEWIVELLKEAFSDQEKQTSILIYIENQKINEEALKILLVNIPKMELTKRHLALKLFRNIDVPLILKYRKELEKYFSNETWAFYELIENGTEEEIYEEYGSVLNDLELAHSYQHDLYVKAKKLAECIVKNGWVTEREIDIIFSEEIEEKWFSYNGILNVYMSGLLQCEKHIPFLASLLVRDEDILLEEAAAALILFQTDEVVKEVAPYLKKQESMIFAVSVIGNTKTDFAVKALIEAYQETKELDDQEYIIEALCHHFSKETMPVIETQMKCEYRTRLVDLEQVVYSFYTIIGESHPELSLWKDEALQRELDYRMAKSNNVIPPQNIPVRVEKKVGRNDPCPCGSGKKFKKCCGK